MTERQFRRRERILSVARELIAEHGYDGVRMRALAERSGVTPKTLYHQFESKENLLRVAVEERFRLTYAAIDAADILKGIDRLFYVIATVADTTRKNRSYAQALAPMLTTSKTRNFVDIRLNTYRKCIQQIKDEGDLVSWADVETTTAMVYRHVNPLYANRTPKSAQVNSEHVTKYDVCLHLRSITQGYTHRVVTEQAKELAQLFAGKRLA
ncbi:MAG: helix-turn-helix domain-containing protein [Pseudomonadales bacterium]|jgi:AcrR family transcriptional regulator|nr:helix-turn-helix domain-containing protein [Pseudomonadales bacterium]|tara:strand:- start:361 stop:993 length:633 start_codon:yes stop_codon:yes gene_type:complete